jgi:hypothetical protein
MTVLRHGLASCLIVLPAAASVSSAGCGSESDALTSEGAALSSTAPPVAWPPKPGTSWQWQLQGTIDTSVDASVFDVDLFNTSQATIDLLHSSGKRVICYFSAGSHEPGRPDSDQFPASAVGKVMDGWPDENWLDIRSADVKAIMQARMDVAVTKKCDGIEPDNVDGYNNDTGFALEGSDQLTYNRFLAAEGHARQLVVALKNDLDQIPQLLGDFDLALNEECAKYDECDALTPFIQAGKAVFQVEYGASPHAVCPKANARNFDILIKHLDLDAYRVACR